MAAILTPAAYAAAGKVFFADGIGEVRSLSISGQVANVTTFPFSGRQQMLSFAVSPDGGRLLGAVFTLPAKPGLACSGTPAVGGYTLDVYSARPGGSSTLLVHQSFTNPDVMALVGWDEVGPLATYPTTWASQGGLPTAFAGTPVRIDSATGNVLKQVAPVSCYGQDIVLSGDYVCGAGNAVISVRRSGG